MKLQTLFPNTKLKLEHVTEEKGAQLWSLLFQKSFGYQIPAAVVLELVSDGEFYILFSEENPIDNIEIKMSVGILIIINNSFSSPTSAASVGADALHSDAVAISVQKGK